VLSWSEAIREELKDAGITVTALLPGPTDTDFFNKADMNQSKIVEDRETLASPEEVAMDGYNALMNDEDKIISGLKNKLSVAMSNLSTDSMAAHRMAEMQKPVTENKDYGKTGKKSVLITGADSGIGRAVALLFATEGADIAIIYHSDDADAAKTQAEIENLGRKCIIFQGDINDYDFCEETTQKVMSTFGKIDILINNAGVQFPADSIEELEEKNIRHTFNSNIVGMILLTK
jgi:short-subunit dehydrogenase